MTETQFWLPDTFPTQESAIEAAIQAGRQKIDVGFERDRHRERLSPVAQCRSNAISERHQRRNLMLNRLVADWVYGSFLAGTYYLDG
jgi:hypothetical protein